jgi:tetratricopeptide (TPR) repeat protein
VEDRANRIAFPLVFGDSASRGRVWSALDTIPAEVLDRVRPRLRGPALLPLGERVRRAVRRRADAKEGDAFALFRAQFNQGRLRAALEQLEDPLLSRDVKYELLYATVTQGLPVPQERLERALTVAEANDPEVLFFAGAFAVDRGRWDEQATVQARLRGAALRSYSEGDTAAARFAEGAALALDGYGRWRQNEREEAATTLDKARVQAVGYAGRETVNGTIRWWLGRLMLELGRPREAASYYRSLLPAALAYFYLGKSYEELGEFGKARDAYELFAIGWKDADPELQPRVQEARAAIQRLTSAVKE